MVYISYNNSKVLYFYGICVGEFLSVDGECLMSKDKREKLISL